MDDLISLDLNAAANAGAWMEVVHPVSAMPIGLRIKLVGTDSDRFRAIIEQQQRERLDAVRAQQPMPADPTVAQRERELQTLAACTVAWEGYDAKADHPVTHGAGDPHLLMAGEKLPCTPEAARRVYGHPGMRWLRDQAENFVGTRANFLRP